MFIAMPSFRETTLDLVRRLGLIAPLTKKKQEYNINYPVKTLQEDGIDAAIFEHCHRSNEDIRASRQLRTEADTLRDTYGRELWRPGSRRPGLLGAGDARAHGFYPKELYWNDAQDNE